MQAVSILVALLISSHCFLGVTAEQDAQEPPIEKDQIVITGFYIFIFSVVVAMVLAHVFAPTSAPPPISNAAPVRWQRVTAADDAASAGIGQSFDEAGPRRRQPTDGEKTVRFSSDTKC